MHDGTNGCFKKLRRWWKGENIFQKSCIFIPIHADLHWSLVIVCILDKEDESGPMILHLDSLGLHSSNLIFNVIASFLRAEWNCLKGSASLTDLPISERIWQNLSERIEKKKIAVPEQKNEYDCGLFVLYFIERFIAEVPLRLKRGNLDKFNRKWFQPEDASNLRKQIRILLCELFEKCKAESLSSGSSAEDTEPQMKVNDSDTNPVTCVDEH